MTWRAWGLFCFREFTKRHSSSAFRTDSSWRKCGTHVQEIHAGRQRKKSCRKRKELSCRQAQRFRGVEERVFWDHVLPPRRTAHRSSACQSYDKTAQRNVISYLSFSSHLSAHHGEKTESHCQESQTEQQG